MTKVIVALDGMEYIEAICLAERLMDKGAFFKANDLLDDKGSEVVKRLKKFGGVMADPKYHDIPNTVANRVKKMATAKPDFITVHASGGVAMMRAAVENCGESKILVVTVLTSLNEEECNINLGGPTKVKVLQYARNAVLADVHGIVCSPKELEFLSQFPELRKLIKITPGIRPKWYLNPNDDQSRVTTPADAVKMGADYIVVGRPIVKAKNPLEALQKTLKEIKEVAK